MEYLRVVEGGKSSPKRDFRSTRGKSHRVMVRNNLLESIARANGGSGATVVSSQTNGDGVVRVKLLVKKEDLKQMVELIRSGNSNSNMSAHQSSPMLSLEQRLNLLRRKQLCRASAMTKASSKNLKGSNPWIPALQSIPEEV